MKKILSLLLIAVMCLSVLASCNFGNINGTTAADTTVGATEGETTTAENEETTVEETEVTTEADTDGGDEESEYNVEGAKAFLKNMYKDYLTNNVTTKSFDLVAQVAVGGVTYPITWASNNDSVTVVAKGENEVTINVPAKGAEEVQYTLTATITAPDNTTAELSFKLSVPAAPSLVPQVVTTPEVGTAYKFFLDQLELGQTLFLTGEMKGYYYATTEDAEAAVDVYLEEAEGGYKFYHEFGGKKQYFAILEQTGGDGNLHTNVLYVEDAAEASVFTWNTEYNTLVTVVTLSEGGDTDHYIGTYKTFGTFSASKLSYAATSFVGHLATLVNTSTIAPSDKVAAEVNKTKLPNESFKSNIEIDLPTVGGVYADVTIAWASDNTQAVVNGNKLTITLGETETTAKLTATFTCGEATETKEFTITIGAIPTDDGDSSKPEVGKAYKLMVVQGNVGKTLYCTGEVANKDYYFASTEDINAAADLYLEAADGGYKVYLDVAGTKKYITIVQNGTFYNAGFVSSAADAVVFNWNSEYSTLTAIVEDGTECYLGMYNTYETFSASKISYAATSFPSQLVVPGEGGNVGGDTDTPDTPPVDVPDDGGDDDVTPVGNATITFDDTSKRTEISTEKQVWEENGITVVNDKAKSNSNISDKYYAPLRLYKNTSVTITAAGKISKIIFDCHPDKPAADLSSAIGANATLDGNTVTVTFEEPVDAFTFEVSVGQVRINSLTVVTA